MFWGAKKNLKKFKKKFLATALKSYIKWLFLLKKFEKVEKTGCFRANTQILKSECAT